MTEQKMTMAEAVRAVLEDPEFWAKLEKLAEEGRVKHAAWVKERMPNILAAVQRDLDAGRCVNNDPYSEFPEDYTAEDIGTLVSEMLDRHIDKQQNNNENPFENEFVVVDGYEYGEMHGQGTFAWVHKAKETAT